MSSVFSCGFSRVAVKESFHKPRSVAYESNPAQRWENYLKFNLVPRVSLLPFLPLQGREEERPWERGCLKLLDESAHEKLAVERTLFVKKSRSVYQKKIHFCNSS